MRRFLRDWRQSARLLKRELYAVYLASRDPRTPWYAKFLAMAILAYAASPIDLIPDPIPVLGHLDDLVLIPLGVALLIRLIPRAVLADARLRADTALAEGRGLGWAGAVFVVLVWVVLLILVGRWAYQYLR